MGNRIFIIRIKDTKNFISFIRHSSVPKFWIEIEVEQNFYYTNYYIKDTKDKISFHLSVFFRKFWIEIELEQNFYYTNYYIKDTKDKISFRARSSCSKVFQ